MVINFFRLFLVNLIEACSYSSMWLIVSLLVMYRINISLIFSSNSEADASELLENIEETLKTVNLSETGESWHDGEEYVACIKFHVHFYKLILKICSFCFWISWKSLKMFPRCWYLLLGKKHHSFHDGSTSACGLRFEPVDSITVHIVPRKHTIMYAYMS